MCKLVDEDAKEAVKTTLADEPASITTKPIDVIFRDVNEILTKQVTTSGETQNVTAEKSDVVMGETDTKSDGVKDANGSATQKSDAGVIVLDE